MKILENNKSDSINKPAQSQLYLWSTCKNYLNYSASLDQSVVAQGDSITLVEKREGPTQHFINNVKSDQDREYLKQYMDLLPMDSILAKETQLLNTHIPLYTACSKETYLLQIFTKMLMSFANIDILSKRLPDDINWFRNPLAKLPKFISPDTSSYLSLRNGKILDNSETAAWNLISCNPHLFSNTLADAMESTVDYWWDDNNVATPKLKDFVIESFSKLNITEVTSLVEDLKNALQLLPSEHGVLYQIFIPHEEVNSTVYISEANGKVDQHYKNTLKGLIDIQYKSPDQIKNYQTMQVRLLAGRFINPDQGADYRAFTYGTFSKNQEEIFQSKVRQLIEGFLFQNRVAA